MSTVEQRAPRVRLVLPQRRGRVRLDADQEAVVDGVALGGAGTLLVLGAPGTGKTTTAIEAFLAALEQGSGNEPLFLAPTRRAAARVRDIVGQHLIDASLPDIGTGRAMVQTVASFAYTVLRHRAVALAEPAPTLITGPEQDAILGELLAGHRDGLGADPRWPTSIGPDTLAQPAFREELRNLLTRAVELGLSPTELAARAAAADRPEWRSAAVVLEEYVAVTALGDVPATRGARYDVAAIVDVATRALESWEADAPGVPRPRWGAVVVDDYQDATLATARLLGALVDDGSRLALFADPDAAVQGFRGATPALVGRATTRETIGGFGAEQVVLPTVWRGGPALREVVRVVSDAVSVVGGARHRRATTTGETTAADGPPTGVECVVVRSAGEEAAHLARRLREERLHHGTPWAEMAVVVRSSAAARVLRRLLRDAGVPVAEDAAQALHAQPAVRPLLVAMTAAASRELSPDEALDLLCSPLGGLDAISLRALRRALRPADIAGATPQAVRAATDELLVELLADPVAAAELPGPHRAGPLRLARVLAAGREAAAVAGGAQEVLWALWDASGLAERWRRRALDGGPAGERADTDLDALMALFKAAEHFDERHPGAGAEAFVTDLLGQDIAADTLAARAQREQTVAVRTPAGTDGAEWQVVAVAGLQEEAWPDLRVRDSLLGAGVLADLEAGRRPRTETSGADRRAARRAVLDDELRMLVVALSRATRRLVVTAVADTEEQPSSFFDLLARTASPPTADGPDAHPPGAGSDERPWRVRRVPPALDLRALVAELRAVLDDPGGDHQEAAARVLAALAARDVPGAHPESWHGLMAPSTDAPLQEPAAPVRVSPSSVETAQTCPLRWALQSAGGRAEESYAQSLGTLIHEIAAEHPHGTAAELMTALDERWPALGLGDGWVDRRSRALAEQMIERLAEYVAAVPGEVDVEQGFSADVGRARLTGRIDRVEHVDATDDTSPEGASGPPAPAAVRVVDLKTSASPVSAEEGEANPQLASYQLAAELGGLGRDAVAAGGRLVYLGTGKTPAQRRQPGLAEADTREWARQLITEAAETMAAAGFIARKNPGCPTCPVRTSCPAQNEGRRVTQ